MFYVAYRSRNFTREWKVQNLPSIFNFNDLWFQNTAMKPKRCFGSNSDIRGPKFPDLV